MHVERLLGLGRVRDAAGKARDEHKRLKASLEGMRSAVVDVGELRGRLEAASRRAMDTPAIAAADEAAVAARAAFDVARRAAAAETVRASQHAALAPRVAPLVARGRGCRGAAGGRCGGAAPSAAAAVAIVERIAVERGRRARGRGAAAALAGAVGGRAGARGGRRRRSPRCASTPTRMRRERPLSRELRAELEALVVA